MPTLGATVEHKNGVLELTKLEYHKKWYFPIYFPNSVSGPNISKINANGPFCPKFESIKLSDCPKVNEESNTMAMLQCWALRKVSKKHIIT